MSRWRTASLVTVHLLIVGHIIHWLIAGKTLAPVEPSEAMYTLNNGQLNAGFIFLGLALAATLLVGRFVCGWGCHLVAYQDLCAWLLKKVGIRPKPFRSRILVFAPLALAVYMFIWPTVHRWWMGIPAPQLTNHMVKARFWETFPGPVLGIVTLLVCGFLIVYFLGSKGFCTYACPYGGFFGLADRVAPGRIMVTDACEHCGHCTAACTSNVRVHEEVKTYGMVVDPGCMKCMDCVSVCPNDALYFGFAKPPVGAKPKTQRRPARYDFGRWEEGLMALVGLVALLALRGLYGRIPLLLAMALAAVTAFLIVKVLRLVRTPNLRLQNLQLKRGGRLTRVGLGFAVFTGALVVFTGHSAAIQYHSWRGNALLRSLSIGDEVWLVDGDWWGTGVAEERSRLDAAITHLERVNRWGLFETPRALEDLVLLYLAKGCDSEAEDAVRRVIALRPHRPDAYRGLAGILRKLGRVEEAESSYRRALSIDASHSTARQELAAMLHSVGRDDDAVALYREATAMSLEETTGGRAHLPAYWPVRLSRLLLNLGRLEEAANELDRLLQQAPNSAEAHALRGVVAMQHGDTETGLEHFRRVVALEPESASGHYDLGMALLTLRKVGPAIEQLLLAVGCDPAMAVAHYNLGVANYMAGNWGESIQRVRESISLEPNDPVAHGFLAVVLRERGDLQGAREAAGRAERLRGGQ